ncbi:hypothetical protein Pta6605_13430 [Pseudomonas amygdali pv. tabaci]|nr:hypothetical protein Pta6605_13430 [Pseudomonas amygdali pv. tabaci]
MGLRVIERKVKTGCMRSVAIAPQSIGIVALSARSQRATLARAIALVRRGAYITK